MTLGELKHILDISVLRDDMAAEYLNWIKLSLRSIQQTHNFRFMEDNPSVTILLGTSSVVMPDRFKELRKAESPVILHASDDDRAIPCEVMRYEDLIRLDSALLWPIFFSNIRRRRFYPVYLTHVDSLWYLNILNPGNSNLVTENMNFTVLCTRFLPDLVNDGDENTLTKEYPELVKAKIKAVAFEEINDPLSDTWETKYQAELRKAIRQDEYAKLAGLNLQMGGT